MTKVEFVDRLKIIEARFENISHTRIGGYNSAVYSPKIDTYEHVRLTDIRGKIRWSLRSLIAASEYYKGKNINLRCIEKRVAEILGYTSNPSIVLFRINVEDYAKPKVYSFSTKDLPARLFLLLGKKKDKKIYQKEDQARVMVYPPHSLKFKISFYVQPYFKEENLPNTKIRNFIGSSFLAFYLKGLGSIVNRGFGCLKLINIETGEIGDRCGLKKYLCYIRNLWEARNPQEIFYNLKNLISISLEDLGVDKPFPIYNHLPPMPILSLPVFVKSLKNAKDLYSPFLVRIYNSNRNVTVEHLLKLIGAATLKSYWKKKRKIYRSWLLHTWILGLPRTGRHKKGYYIYNEESSGRRQSAISFRLHELYPGRYLIFTYALASSDWPISKLVHVGSTVRYVKNQYIDKKHKKILELGNKAIYEIILDAWESIDKILSDGGFYARQRY